MACTLLDVIILKLTNNRQKCFKAVYLILIKLDEKANLTLDYFQTHMITNKVELE